MEYLLCAAIHDHDSLSLFRRSTRRDDVSSLLLQAVHDAEVTHHFANVWYIHPPTLSRDLSFSKRALARLRQEAASQEPFPLSQNRNERD